jgi:hypothetical protein
MAGDMRVNVKLSKIINSENSKMTFIGVRN